MPHVTEKPAPIPYEESQWVSAHAPPVLINPRIKAPPQPARPYLPTPVYDWWPDQPEGDTSPSQEGGSSASSSAAIEQQDDQGAPPTQQGGSASSGLSLTQTVHSAAGLAPSTPAWDARPAWHSMPPPPPLDTRYITPRRWSALLDSLSCRACRLPWLPTAHTGCCSHCGLCLCIRCFTDHANDVRAAAARPPPKAGPKNGECSWV